MKHPTEAEPSSAITPAQESRLEVLEKKIKVGLKNYEAMGEALAEIKKGRLYKLRGFGDFGDYCEATFNGLSRTHADRLVEAVKAQRIIQTLTPVGRTRLSERTMRPLFWLKENEQKKVWKAVIKKTPDLEQITGKLVSDVKVKLLKRGRNGHPVPPVVKVGRDALCDHLEVWFDKAKSIHQLAGKALLCKIVAHIRRYDP